MTVETTNSYTGPYTTNGSTTEFPFDFDTVSDSDVSVILVDSDGVETEASGFTVSRTDGGGTVTFSTAPSSGFSLFVLLDPDFTQSTDFNNGGTYLASAHNAALNRAALRSIRNKRDIDRAFKVPFGETGFQVPAEADRAGYYLGFNASGAPVAIEGTGDDGTVRPDLASTDAGKGAEMVGFKQSGTGAIARTVLSKLRERVSVFDFMTEAQIADVEANTALIDVTSAIQEAIDEVSAVGGKVFFPKGTYLLSSAITVDTLATAKGIILEGEGRNTILSQSGTGANAIDFSSTALLQNSGIRDLKIICDADAGHCIKIGLGITTCFVTNVDMVQQNPGKSLIYGDFSAGTAGSGIYDTVFSGGSWYCAATSTAPGVKIICNNTRFNENVFRNLRCYNSTTEQFFHISTVTTGSVWLVNNTFEHINFEVCKGGGIYFENFRNCEFRSLSFWDAQGNYTNHIIEMGTGVGIESISNTFTSVGRHGDALAVGVYDLKITSGQDTTLINCYTQNGDGPAFDFNNKRVNIIGTFAGTITNGGGVFQVGNQNGEIKFPGTINGSFLTYYDEGTWTATLSGSGGAPTTPVTATGAWTRIGRLVHLSVEFTNVDTTGASGSVAVNGLPFTANATHRSVGPTAMAGFGTTAAVARAAGTQIQLFQSTSRTTNITHADGGAAGPGKYLSISISFIV